MLIANAPATPTLAPPPPEMAVAAKWLIPSPSVTVCTVIEGAVTLPPTTLSMTCPSTFNATATPTPMPVVTLLASAKLLTSMSPVAATVGAIGTTMTDASSSAAREKP